MVEIVAVFDFDKTIIDGDSDNWVVDELGFTSRFDEQLQSFQWNTMMDKLMGEMHSSGIEIKRIAEVLRRIPIHPRVVPAIKAAHALGCDLRIVSDANTFFIETILEHLEIKDLFSEINTNPSFIDEQGRLRILPYHDFKTSPHGCGLCPPNMCKGLIVQRIQASVSGDEKKRRFIYLGDGAGDYCPTVKLGESDFVMPRKDFPLWDLMLKNPSLIKAEVHEWADGQDQETALLGIIRRIVKEEEEEEEDRSRSTYGQQNQLSSAAGLADCKSQTIAAVAGHEEMRRVLPVPH